MGEVHNITQKDLFYDLDDIINLFANINKDFYYKNRKVIRTIPVWTGECASKLTYYKRCTID